MPRIIPQSTNGRTESRKIFGIQSNFSFFITFLIGRNAYALIIAHNHPSGDTTPSHEDIDLTKSLIEIGRLHQIPIVDHLIIGSPSANNGIGFTSIRNLAILDFA